jgi:DNA-binding LacI/PurR family transcriptional regulator
MPSHATLKDVATAVGVSPSTVSRALRGHPAVRQDTRRRVQAAATRLGYQPNQAASALRTQSSPFIGIVVPDITIPFFGLAVKAAQDVLERSGYQVLIMNTDRDPKQERRALKTLQSHRAQGVLVATSGGFEHSPRMPAVFFANFASGEPVGRVALSNKTGIRLLVDHLVDVHHHRRIVYIGGAPTVTSGVERLSAFKESMAEAGLADEIRVCVSDHQWSTESVEEAIAEYLALECPPTAFIAGGDTFALGALKVIRRLGLRVPDDVALVTFQDPDRVGGVLEPPLTTIASQESELGHHAAAMLLHTLNVVGGGNVAIEARLPATLVVRGSCGCSPETAETFNSAHAGVDPVEMTSDEVRPSAPRLS